MRDGITSDVPASTPEPVHYVFKIINTVAHVFLEHDIEVPWAYTGLVIEFLALPPDVERIQVHLNSPGGAMEGSFRLYDLFRNCNLPVEVIVTTEASSAAALIALSGTSLELREGAHMMFHNFKNLSLSGDGREYVDRVVDFEKLSNKLDKLWYAPFLDDVEIEKVANNGAVLIHWDDPTLRARLKRHFRRRNKK